MMRVRLVVVFALFTALVGAPVWAQYPYGGGMPGGMGMGMGMSPYGWGGQGMMGMGAQVPNMVSVREGQAIYCAVYGDLIDYQVYPKYVPMDQVADNYWDDGTHGDEVAYDGVPTNIEENRDTYLGPFAIKYKNILKKVIIDSIIAVMDRGPFAVAEQARSRALSENIDQLKNMANKGEFEALLRQFTVAVLERDKKKARGDDIIRVINQAQKIVENRIVMDRLSDARVVRATATIKHPDALQFYRIPVAAEGRKSTLMQYNSITSNLTDKIIEWSDTLYAQFIAPDGRPYDDERYRFRLDVSALQNQQGLGLQGGYGAGRYGGPGGGPPQLFAIQRAQDAAAAAEEAGAAAAETPPEQRVTRPSGRERPGR